MNVDKKIVATVHDLSQWVRLGDTGAYTYIMGKTLIIRTADKINGGNKQYFFFIGDGGELVPCEPLQLTYDCENLIIDTDHVKAGN